MSWFIVYRMGKLCGGAHEISGIKALRPLVFSVGGGGLGRGSGGVCGVLVRDAVDG